MNDKGYIISGANGSIDVFKFIMAIVVIAIHAGPLPACTNEAVLKYYDIFVSLAVPFFFLASGYLISLKIQSQNKGEEVIKKHTIKLIKMYAILSLLYCPMAVHYYMSEKTPISRMVLLLSRRFFLIGEQYNAWHLWYLLSSIYALILCLLLYKLKAKAPVYLILGVVIALISIGFDYIVTADVSGIALLNTLSALVKNTISSGKILQGAAYIPLGFFLSHKKLSIRASIVAFCLGVLTAGACDQFALSRIIYIILAVAFFGIVVNIKLGDGTRFLSLRRMSSIVYYIHMYVFVIYSSIVYGNVTKGLDRFIVTTIISIIIAGIYVMIFKKRKSSK